MKNPICPEVGIQVAKAIVVVGGAAALARALGVTTQAVCFWRDGKRRFPEALGAPIDKATGGQVSRRDLWPNNWQVIWPELADPAVIPKIDPNQPLAPVQRTQAAIETIANVIEATDRASWAVVKHQNACAESAAVAGQGF